MAIVDKRTVLFNDEIRKTKLNKGCIHLSSYLDLQNSNTEKGRTNTSPLKTVVNIVRRRIY